MKRNHLFVNQILNFVLEVDEVLDIMSYVVGVIRTLLIRSVEFRIGIHRLRPHQVNVLSHKHSLVQLCLDFDERGKVFGGLLLKSRSRWIITVLLGRSHLLITSGMWTERLVSQIRICFVFSDEAW